MDSRLFCKTCGGSSFESENGGFRCKSCGSLYQINTYRELNKIEDVELNVDKSKSDYIKLKNCIDSLYTVCPGYSLKDFDRIVEKQESNTFVGGKNIINVFEGENVVTEDILNIANYLDEKQDSIIYEEILDYSVRKSEEYANVLSNKISNDKPLFNYNEDFWKDQFRSNCVNFYSRVMPIALEPVIGGFFDNAKKANALLNENPDRIYNLRDIIKLSRGTNFILLKKGEVLTEVGMPHVDLLDLKYTVEDILNVLTKKTNSDKQQEWIQEGKCIECGGKYGPDNRCENCGLYNPVSLKNLIEESIPCMSEMEVYNWIGLSTNPLYYQIRNKSESRVQRIRSKLKTDEHLLYRDGYYPFYMIVEEDEHYSGRVKKDEEEYRKYADRTVDFIGKKRNLCRYCGGTINSLTKKCKKCGKNSKE